MRYRYFLTTTAAFIAVVLTGGVWIGVAGQFAPGRPGMVVTVLGAVFSAAFVWLLLTRLRAFLAHPERRLLELALLTLNFSILMAAFAWVHHRIGLMDVSGIVPRVTHDFWDALYFSIVTGTTLGYGDFLPLKPGRPVAALQALVGYMILGIMVSAGFQILAPSQDDDERGDGGSPERPFAGVEADRAVGERGVSEDPDGEAGGAAADGWTGERGRSGDGS